MGFRRLQPDWGRNPGNPLIRVIRVQTYTGGTMLSFDLPPLIPREDLFGNPEKASPQLSPDGRRLAYLAPDEGVLNVWLRTVGQEDDRAITRDRKRGIRMYLWAFDGRHLLYLQDSDG